MPTCSSASLMSSNAPRRRRNRVKKISSLLRNKLRESVKGIVQNGKSPGPDVRLGAWCSARVCEADFRFIRSDDGCGYDFSTSRQVCCCGCVGLSVGLLNSDAECPVGTCA